MTIRIVLADDHKMLREGLRTILENEPELEVVGEADDGRLALKLVRELSPDLVVMDIGMPNLNGIEATRQIRSSNAKVKVIALSMHSDKRYVLRMLEAGASGYVLKSAACDELVRAIAAVTREQSYLSPEIASIVVDNYMKRPTPGRRSTFGALRPREREVLQLLAEGLTNIKIAARLHISPRTVEAHRRNIMRKLDIHSIAELTKYAVREGLTLP